MDFPIVDLMDPVACYQFLARSGRKVGLHVYRWIVSIQWPEGPVTRASRPWAAVFPNPG